VSRRIEADGDTASLLTLFLEPLCLGHLAGTLRSSLYTLLRVPMRRYLKSVGGGAYYAQTGDPITRNQFGPHRWFSPKSVPMLP